MANRHAKAPILSGTEGGVDKHLTTAIYRAKKDKALTPLQAGTLRGIQAGSVRPQENLCSSGLVDTPNCHWGCGVIEDIQHLLWACPKWKEMRDKHWGGKLPDWRSWPSRLSCAGIVPRDPNWKQWEIDKG